MTATAYLIGAVIGAIGFGYATDRLGRKKLFTVTLLVYLLATAATALSWNFWSYAIFRAITGDGHRWRVRRHQLCHRRTDPSARTRARRPHHQRHVLDRRCHRRRGNHRSAESATSFPPDMDGVSSSWLEPASASSLSSFASSFLKVRVG